MNRKNIHPQTIATLDALNEIVWFRNCGVADLGDARILSSWREAGEYSSSVDWQKIRLEGSHTLRSALMYKDKYLFNLWDHVSDLLKPLTTSFVDKKLKSHLDPQIADKIRDDVNTDILGLCMECEFIDHVKSGFYHHLASYYESGHFPCGMEGEPASGRAIIY